MLVDTSLPLWRATVAATSLSLITSVANGQSNSGSFQYISNSSLPAPDLPESCASALMSSISCDPWVANFRSGQYYSPDGLDAVCTSGCHEAIQDYRSDLEQACSGQTFNYTGAKSLPVSALGSLLLYNYELTCLQDKGRFCNYLGYEASLQADPDAPAILGQPTNNDTISQCDDCFVKQLQLQAGSPFDGGSDLASGYASLTSSCSVDGMPLTTTSISSSTLSPTTTGAPPSATCSGKTYDVKSGDTCRSIAKSQGISVGWLVLDNPDKLRAYCANFTASGSLCIQDTCDTYTVQQGDNCTSIAKGNNITETQLLTWNPVLNPTCSNLGLSVNDSLCVGKPGKPYSTPTVALPAATSFSTAASVPTDLAANSSTHCGKYYRVQEGDYCNRLCLKFSLSLDDLVFLNPGLNANCTNLFAQESYCVEPVGSINDYPGHPGYIAPTSSISKSAYSSFPTATFTMPDLNISTPLPVANATRSDCFLYVDGEDLQQSVEGTWYQSVCDLYARTYQVSLEMLENWNPSLQTNSSECGFDLGVRYCMSAYNSSQVSTPVEEPLQTLPLRDGTLTNCTEYTAATANVDCSQILSWYNISIAQFFAWNPAVGDDCSSLWLDYSYCVSVTNHTDAPNDNDNASNTITASPTTAPATASPTAFPTTATPPAPTQSGQPDDCVEWYVPVKGDTCATVQTAYLISSEQFHAWNPAVSSDCATGFWAGEAYCVGTSNANPSRISTSSAAHTSTSSGVAVPGPTQANSIPSNCNKYAQAQKGDYCFKFAQDQGIEAAQLYEWNRVLGDNGADCGSKFWGGEWYCVGVSS